MLAFLLFFTFVKLSSLYIATVQAIFQITIFQTVHITIILLPTPEGSYVLPFNFPKREIVLR